MCTSPSTSGARGPTPWARNRAPKASTAATKYMATVRVIRGWKVPWRRNGESSRAAAFDREHAENDVVPPSPDTRPHPRQATTARAQSSIASCAPASGVRVRRRRRVRRAPSRRRGRAELRRRAGPADRRCRRGSSIDPLRVAPDPPPLHGSIRGPRRERRDGGSPADAGEPAAASRLSLSEPTAGCERASAGNIRRVAADHKRRYSETPRREPRERVNPCS